MPDPQFPRLRSRRRLISLRPRYLSLRPRCSPRPLPCSHLWLLTKTPNRGAQHSPARSAKNCQPKFEPATMSWITLISPAVPSTPSLADNDHEILSAPHSSTSDLECLPFPVISATDDEPEPES
ncbi:hypothetical protein EDB85DRAFT_2292813, partial [Lactarius pseudohatsudake]